MKIIKALNLNKYRNKKRYEHHDGFIHKDKSGGVAGEIGGKIVPVYCITLYVELEPGDDTQYPLEDILDKYCVNCTDVMEEKTENNKNIFIFEVECEDVESIQSIANLIGKRVYNYEDGDYMRLKIE